MRSLMMQDTHIYQAIIAENARQMSVIELIASENFVSKAVLDAQGSILTNKYAEGYSGKRYYSGCEHVDVVETIAINRAKDIFSCQYVNVQPHSGSNANQTVFFSLLKPGDTILGMSLNSGGHLTHGAAPNISGKWFNAVHYDVNPETYLIDYDQIERLANIHRPKLIIAGYSAYSRALDFAKFRSIADQVGAYLMADIAHIAGLVVTGYHQNPINHAHIVTSTTHKTLRGPRGGIVMTNDENIAKLMNSSLFPGLQGGPLMHVIAAKAVAFLEASRLEFKDYIAQVLKNAQVMSSRLEEYGYHSLTGGTDNHLFLLDLRSHGITGKLATDALDKAGITCNKNALPFDSASPFITSGIRIGTPACTTRGFKEKESAQVADMIAEVLNSLKGSNDADNEQLLLDIKQRANNLCDSIDYV